MGVASHPMATGSSTTYPHYPESDEARVKMDGEMNFLRGLSENMLKQMQTYGYFYLLKLQNS